MQHALGTATLRARFPAGAKELSVSLYQAVILLLFNGADEVPFADIKTATRMGECHPRGPQSA
jgi:cullin-4